MVRKKVLVPALLLMGAVVVGFAVPPAKGGEYAPEVGEPFPRLVLPSLADGSPLSVASFSGEKLVLHIWASW